ncbi:MAG: cyclic nucleotide-binding domain-containing protein [Betaproteobacteria bacterium]|nr:cyclic nucleotide-binding domain-containing protein [Betaproteobacteria bacterium]
MSAQNISSVRSLTSTEDVVALLKTTAPFQQASEDALRRIAALARRESYAPGDVLYRLGDAADDLYIMVSGRVDHALGTGSGARTLNQTMKPGDVFGWSALMKDQYRRLAQATCTERAELLRIDGHALVGLLEADPATGGAVLSRFSTLITQDFTLPEELVHVLSVAKRVEQVPLTRASMDDLVLLLKKTMPFQVVSDEMLRRVAKLSRRERYHPGEIIYRVGDQSDDIFIMVSGKVEHALGLGSGARTLNQTMNEGDVFGWAALLKDQPARLASTTCLEKAEVIRMAGNDLIRLFESDPATGDVVMSRFATMITRDFTLPEELAQVLKIPKRGEEAPPTGLGLTMYRMALWVKSPWPYLMVAGFGLFLAFWYLAVEVWQLPRFKEMPGITTVVKEWLNPDPTYGLSVYTSEYYQHIWVSVRRVAIAFLLATGLGVPLGLFLGWSRNFREYVFPVFETLRPIPILAWVPLAIIMFTGSETPVIYLTFLASFFATALNTMLGVESIDESYTRAAYCLGANKWQVFGHVIVPGAMPFIFTGLQISVGVAWFSLVAAEMVSGQYGLGYVINSSYMMVRYPTIVIGMVTLGAVGYTTSALVRIVGDYMMQWRVRELALGAR